jgi:hypothetical protein
MVSFHGFSVWRRCRRPALGQVLREVDGRLLAALQAKLAEHAGQVLGERQPLLHERHQVMTAALPANNQGRLLQEEGIDMVQVEPGADCHVHEGLLSGADCGTASKVVDEFTAPVEKVAGGDCSPVEDGQSPHPHLGLQGVQTGARTDRSPSGPTRGRTISLRRPRITGERRVFCHQAARTRPRIGTSNLKRACPRRDSPTRGHVRRGGARGRLTTAAATATA